MYLFETADWLKFLIVYPEIWLGICDLKNFKKFCKYMQEQRDVPIDSHTHTLEVLHSEC